MNRSPFYRFKFFLSIIRKSGKDVDILVEKFKINPDDPYNTDPSFFERYIRKELVLGISENSSNPEIAMNLMRHLESTFEQIKFPIYPQLETLEYEMNGTIEYEKIYSFCGSLLSEESLKTFYQESKKFLHDEVNSQRFTRIKTNIDEGADLVLEWTGKSKVFFALMSVLTETNDRSKALLRIAGVKSNKTATRKVLAKFITVPKETNSNEFYRQSAVAHNCDNNAAYFLNNKDRSELRANLKRIIEDLEK